MCGFIAQLVEHRTGIAEVTGSNPVEALIFFRLLHSNCLNWKFTAKIIYHLHIHPQFIYESFHILHVIAELYLRFAIAIIVTLMKQTRLYVLLNSLTYLILQELELLAVPEGEGQLPGEYDTHIRPVLLS